MKKKLPIGTKVLLFKLETLEKKGLITKEKNGYLGHFANGERIAIVPDMIENWNKTHIVMATRSDYSKMSNGHEEWSYLHSWIRRTIK